MDADDRRHGTPGGARAHWKRHEAACGPCLAADRRKSKQRELARMAGSPATLPLGEAAWRIVRDTPRNQLARLTGMPHHRLRRYELGGPGYVVHAATRTRILAARPEWSLIGIQRRLQALTRLGWSMGEVARLAGVDMDALKRLRGAAHRTSVKTHIAEGVLTAWADLHMALPPPGRGPTMLRTVAARKGWPPPLAWDDIDDPDEAPKGHGPGRKTWSVADLIAEVEHMRSLGESLHQIARSLGVTVGAIERAYERKERGLMSPEPDHPTGLLRGSLSGATRGRLGTRDPGEAATSRGVADSTRKVCRREPV